MKPTLDLKRTNLLLLQSLLLSVNYVLIVLRILSAGFIERAPGDCRVDFKFLSFPLSSFWIYYCINLIYCNHLKSIRNMPDQNIFSDLSMASPLHPSVVGFLVQFLSPFCTHVSLTIFVGNGSLWSRLSIWSLDRCFD